MRVQDHVLLTTAAVWNLDCLGLVVRPRRDMPHVPSIHDLSSFNDAKPY
jgi:hypothetical protein